MFVRKKCVSGKNEAHFPNLPIISTFVQLSPLNFIQKKAPSFKRLGKMMYMLCDILQRRDYKITIIH